MITFSNFRLKNGILCVMLLCPNFHKYIATVYIILYNGYMDKLTLLFVIANLSMLIKL